MKTAVVFKSCQNFVKNDFMNFLFPKMCPFYVTPGQNTILTEPKELFSYINPFDSCLIMKMTHPTVQSDVRQGRLRGCHVTSRTNPRGRKSFNIYYLWWWALNICRRRIKTELSWQSLSLLFGGML